MSAGNALERAEPTIIDLDGPPAEFVELPLDYWVTPNGELEPENHPQASRLVQRIQYMTFCLIAPAADAQAVHSGTNMAIDRVRARLRELGGGFIWWRKRPTASTEDGQTKMVFRLGTLPSLPDQWWTVMSIEVGNTFDPRRMLGRG